MTFPSIGPSIGPNISSDVEPGKGLGASFSVDPDDGPRDGPGIRAQPSLRSWPGIHPTAGDRSQLPEILFVLNQTN